MRAITQPPPSSRCEKCGGELRLKQIETAERGLNLDNEIFVCANCGLERSLTVSHDHKIPLAGACPGDPRLGMRSRVP